MSERPTAHAVLQELTGRLNAYRQGEINALQVEALLTAYRKRLDSACWCNEGVCCDAHRNHLKPHAHCFLARRPDAMVMRHAPEEA